MACHVHSCPNRKSDEACCPVEVSEDPKQKPVKRNRSLVVVSLELGRVLADHGKVTFRAQGTCMYPCVQPGDLITIESRSIEQLQVGDIVVFRRNDLLFGHRAIAKGVHEGRTYVETRPDRSTHGSDGPSYADDILGVFTSISRHHADVPLHPQPLRGFTSLRAAVWEWWNWNAYPLLLKVIVKMQDFAWYKRTATMWLNRTKGQRRFIVRVPLSANQSHDLYREFPAEQFMPEQPLWQGKPALRWILDLHFPHEKTVAGTATLAWHPIGCPRGEGWIIEEQQVRLRYRGAGLEDELYHQAGMILARGGMTLQRIPT